MTLDISESVDSEVFQTGPFQHAYAMGNYSDSHHVSNPFELSTTPIEVNESRKQKAMEINNRYVFWTGAHAA